MGLFFIYLLLSMFPPILAKVLSTWIDNKGFAGSIENFPETCERYTFCKPSSSFATTMQKMQISKSPRHSAAMVTALYVGIIIKLFSKSILSASYFEFQMLLLGFGSFLVSIFIILYRKHLKLLLFRISFPKCIQDPVGWMPIMPWVIYIICLLFFNKEVKLWM